MVGRDNGNDNDTTWINKPRHFLFAEKLSHILAYILSTERKTRLPLTDSFWNWWNELTRAKAIEQSGAGAVGASGKAYALPVLG